MSTYTCPQGHASGTGDYCDECGAKIGGAPASAPSSPAASTSGPSAPAPTATAVFASPVATPPASATGAICPHCGTPQAGTDRFCEDCGFDHTTGLRPPVGPADGAPTGPTGPARPTGQRQWTATVTADRAYFDANGIDGVEFPPYCPQRTFTLPSPQVRIGRRSVSKGTDPEMDLSAQPLDPGISHSHALLTLDLTGVWLVSDLGSTNGTYVNDEPTPLAPGRSRPLADGDRVHVGAWTTITIHAPG